MKSTFWDLLITKAELRLLLFAVLYLLLSHFVDQLEWLTGGECAAGMHEVVVSESTLQAVEESQKAGRSLWRVSSTVSAYNTIEFFWVKPDHYRRI